MDKRLVYVGAVPIGKPDYISVQSMTNTKTRDVAATVEQIHALAAAGGDIVRVSVPDRESAAAIRSIRDQIPLPLVADIHFDYRLAIEAMENGADKIRFNPGNIGDAQRVRALVACAKSHQTPIRIGVNGGSLEADIRERFGGATPEALVESALRHVRLLEDEGFYDIVISLKSSSVANTVETYRLMAKTCAYPLHIGVTETGTPEDGIVKSAIGLGALLLDGIGDTIRVSLSDNPVREVETGLRILRALHLRRDDVEIISCPTCARTNVELLKIIDQVSSSLPRRKGYLKVAVMGCAVNGPGEAGDADIGIAFGAGNGVLFKRGEKVASGQADEMIAALIREATMMLERAAEQ